MRWSRTLSLSELVDHIGRTSRLVALKDAIEERIEDREEHPLELFQHAEEKREKEPRKSEDQNGHGVPHKEPGHNTSFVAARSRSRALLHRWYHFSMRRNIIFALLLAAIVGLGIFLSFNKQEAVAPTQDEIKKESPVPQKNLPEVMDDGTVVSDSPSTTVDTGETAPTVFDMLVTYTGTSFDPETVTLKVGDTIRFQNNANDSTFWPMSRDYTGGTRASCSAYSLDACRPIRPGDHWQFTVVTPGTFTIEDFQNKKATVTMIVTK